MSFWEDLQAWTQAQYDALMLANLKRKRKWTAEDINKLLRDRIANRLKAKQGRAIGAEFLRTAGRIPPAQEPIELGPVEHGWLTGTAPNWTIYTWSSMAAYLAGQGITIGADGEYATTITGRVTPTALADDPERYSGLMRLLVQSLVGAGRHVVDIMPLAAPPYDGMPYWGFVSELPNVGLMRSPDKSYWLIKQVLQTGDAGCGIYAVKLTFPSAIADLITLANSGTLNTQNQQLADAWILSQAVKPLTATIKILSRADFIASGGFLGDNFAGFLTYRQQQRGASDELVAGGQRRIAPLALAMRRGISLSQGHTAASQQARDPQHHLDCRRSICIDHNV